MTATLVTLERLGCLVDDTRILDDISMDITAGPPTVVIGPNGSGKTTLLRVVMGLVTPTHGGLTFPSTSGAPPMRRAIVFQRPTMLRRSVAANLRFALTAAGAPRQRLDADVDQLLRRVSLHHLAGRPARRLSAGEQQRVALARALARQPTLLLLDEPTASLDPAATKAVEDIIRSVSEQGTKIVMSTHDLGQARRLAGDVVLLHRGQVIETGAAPLFFEAPRTQPAQHFLSGHLLA